MGKIKKFATLGMRSMSGGKDPLKLIEEFITRLGFDVAESSKEKTADSARWMVTTAPGEDLEILVENFKVPQETTVYLGLNTVTVPIKGATEVLASALQIADGLIGIKVSLVGHFLVLSASLGTHNLSVDDLEYHYRLITAQQEWFRETLVDELGWEQLPDE